MNDLIFGDVLQKFSKRFAEARTFPRSAAVKSAPALADVGAFAADLDHADHFVARENGRADNFLNRFAGIDAACFYAFKNSRMPRRGKIVVDLRAAVSRRARSESGIARQRNEPDIPQSFGNQKMKMTPRVETPNIATSSAFTLIFLRDSFGDGSRRDRSRLDAGVSL